MLAFLGKGVWKHFLGEKKSGGGSREVRGGTQPSGEETRGFVTSKSPAGYTCIFQKHARLCLVFKVGFF